MAGSKRPPVSLKRAITISDRIYCLLLHAYPVSFRVAFGSRMAQVFRESCRDALHQRGLAGLLPLWFQALDDLLVNAFLERCLPMQRAQPRLWMARIATGIAFVVSLLVSINLYLLEDDNPLTNAAYSASPLLRLSYDGVYLSALAACVVICALVGYALVQSDRVVVTGLACIGLFVALAGFRGLLVRSPLNFFAFFLVFAGLVLVSLLPGRAVAARFTLRVGRRTATLMGACASTGIALLINLGVLIPHTLALNPVSHTLFMQGQIGETHFNSLVVGLGVEVLTVMIALLCIGFLLRLRSPVS